MGFIKTAKANLVSQDAAKAIAEGRHLFVAQLQYPTTQISTSGEIVDWSMMLEAIELEGWMLDSIAPRGDKAIIAVFRRFSLP